MTTEALRQQLQDYIHYAPEEQLQAIYSVVQKEVSQQNEWWEQESVVAGLDARAAALDDGSDAGLSWDEVKEALQNRKK